MTTPTLTTHTYPLPPGVDGHAVFCTHVDEAFPAGLHPAQGELVPACHRYALYRERNDQVHNEARHMCRSLACIAMNPSAAAADRDDQTVRLLWLLARREGYCKLVVLNAYSYRSTDPKGLLLAADPVGTKNDARILTEVSWADTVLVCWGIISKGRDHRLRELIQSTSKRAVCLAITAGGYPRHPLRTRIHGAEWQPLDLAS